jgi:hypothetical protein
MHDWYTLSSYLCLHLELQGKRQKLHTLKITTTFAYFIHLNTTYNFSTHLSNPICSDKLKQSHLISFSHNIITKYLKTVFLLPQNLHMSTTANKFNPPQVSTACRPLYRYNTHSFNKFRLLLSSYPYFCYKVYLNVKKNSKPSKALISYTHLTQLIHYWGGYVWNFLRILDVIQYNPLRIIFQMPVTVNLIHSY